MSAPVTLDVDPYAEPNLLDPYPLHAAVREAGPAVWLPRYRVVAVGRFAGADAMLRDHRRYCSSAGVGLTDFRTEPSWRPPSPLIEADPPHHARARQIMAAVVSSRALRAFRAGFQRVAEEMVDGWLERGEIDAITDLAEAYPLRVFPDVVGLPTHRRDGLLPYGDMNFNSFGPDTPWKRRAFEREAELHAWMAESCRRDTLAPGGLGEQLWKHADRGDLTPEEAALLVRSLLTAGVDTTVNGLGNTIKGFLDFPDQWEALHGRPGDAAFAFDEALRLESPIQTFFRTTTEDVEVVDDDEPGCVIPAGTKVMVLFGSANRDPRRWGADADRLRIDRDAGGHLAFGMGIHQCVGQPIARLEADVLLSTLARRVRRIEPTGTPRPRVNNTLHGWSRMPIRLHPA